MIQNNITTFRCRLCQGELISLFQLEVLNKYDVHYFSCKQCKSLQTEEPYWLEEAYGDSNLSNLDTGAAQRNLDNLAAVYAICKLFNFKNVIDVGGGDGLLTRLLRDFEINCYAKDKFAKMTYAQGFTEENFDHPDLVLGFELIEHYPHPSMDLDDLFAYKPKAIFLSTGIYNNHQEDWWYLVPESGQHIFFYSKEALELIATKYQYHLIMRGGYILFIQEKFYFKKWLVRKLIKGGNLRRMKTYLMTKTPHGVGKDFSLHSKLKQK